jgi:hypothetical protein
MYTVGQLLQGERYSDNGETEVLTGTFCFRTDDPEEYIQDIVLDVPGKGRVYFDERDIHQVIYL